MEIHLSLLCTSTEESLTGNLLVTATVRGDPYRGTSPVRNTHLRRITIGP